MSDWPSAGGETAARIRAHDWAATPLGRVETWPQSLRTVLDLMLGSAVAMVAPWGEQGILLYNDAYARLIGARGATALGRPVFEALPELRAVLEPQLAEARTGRTVQAIDQLYPFVRDTALEDAWFDVCHTPVRGEGGAILGVLTFLTETTARVAAERRRREAEAVLRADEERQAFLLGLSDALRPLADPAAIETRAMQVLGACIGTARARYWRRDADGVHFVSDRGHAPDRGGLPSRIRALDFGAAVLDAVGSGRTLAVPDAQADPRIEATERESYRAIGVRAFLAVPLVKAGRLAAALTVSWAEPHACTDREIALVEETAERTWAAVERARAEAALRASEEERRSLIARMSDGFCILEVILDEAGRGLDYRFLETNPAFVRQGGFDPAGRLMSEIAPIEPIWPAAYGRVAATGVPERIVDAAAAFGRMYDVYAFRIGAAAERRVAVFFSDITERRRAEAALRESEERQVFLLGLADALRPLDEPDRITATATRLLGQRLGASRAYYAEWPPGEDYAEVARDYVTPGLQSLVGRYPIAVFRSAYDRISQGRTWVVEDAAADAEIGAAERRYYLDNGVVAWVDVPLIKRGRTLAALCLVQDRARRWTGHEIALVEETAERCWAAIERARAERALRASEARFAQFADASSDGIWIRDAASLAMEYTSPAFATIYGVPPEALLGDLRRWAGLIVPEDRDRAVAHLEQARHGEAVTHEFRIQRPSDGGFRWIRNTDFPLRGDGGVQRIGGIAEDVTEAKLAAEHQAVLLAELQHRVRNIMAMIRAVTERTGERAASVPDYASLMMGRLLALARVQALLTRAANVRVGIRALVQDEVSVQAQSADQYVLDGPDVALPPKAAEVLTLAVHELATNALKYGALSVPHGRVAVRWAIVEKRGTSWLAFDWSEEGAPERPQPASDAPRRRGFGSELIEGRVPYELKGSGRIAIGPGGARCRLEFPLRDGASLLGTHAPQRATVFGGALDMTGEADLSGHRILVVEDDYYLATDAARALRGAGAEVIGPVSTEDDARDELERRRPDAAVLDINLGLGPSFTLAERLRGSRIPFVFTTGYDQGVIPEAFGDVERLEKPVQLRQIVAAVSRLLQPAA